MKNEFKPFLVAVYGSLRHGLHNHRIIDHCEINSIETTPKLYKMKSLGGFPGVLLEGDKSIVIETYKVTDQDTANNLDRLEGYPSFYDKIDIKLNSGEDAKMYFLPNTERYNSLEDVKDGDWFKNMK